MEERGEYLFFLICVRKRVSRHYMVPVLRTLLCVQRTHRKPSVLSRGLFVLFSSPRHRLPSARIPPFAGHEATTPPPPLSLSNLQYSLTPNARVFVFLSRCDGDQFVKIWFVLQKWPFNIIVRGFLFECHTGVIYRPWFERRKKEKKTPPRWVAPLSFARCWQTGIFHTEDWPLFSRTAVSLCKANNNFLTIVLCLLFEKGWGAFTCMDILYTYRTL